MSSFSCAPGVLGRSSRVHTAGAQEKKSDGQEGQQSDQRHKGLRVRPRPDRAQPLGAQFVWPRIDEVSLLDRLAKIPPSSTCRPRNPSTPPANSTASKSAFDYIISYRCALVTFLYYLCRGDRVQVSPGYLHACASRPSCAVFLTSLHLVMSWTLKNKLPYVFLVCIKGSLH